MPIRIALALLLLAPLSFSVWHGVSERKVVALLDDEVVDEAFKRVPIPPSPEVEVKPSSLRTNERFSGNTQLVSRELLGMSTVSSAVADPTRECAGGERERFTCYAHYLVFSAQTESIAESFVRVKELYNKGDNYAISQCHQLVHVIGRAAATMFPTVAEAYNYGDTFCWSGYYHGIMEALIAEIGAEELPARMNSICAELPGKSSYSFNYFNCVHGLGHGLMYVEGHDLFKALSSCDAVEGGWERESCYGGVYMENVIANEVDHVSLYLKEGDLLYPCNAVGEKYKQQCYLMQTSYMLGEVNQDFSQVFALCAQVEEGYTHTCYQSLGRDASGQSNSRADETKATCLLGQDEFAQKHCVIGAVKDFVSYYHSDREARAFCESLSGELKKTCVATVDTYYTTFD